MSIISRCHCRPKIAFTHDGTPTFLPTQNMSCPIKTHQIKARDARIAKLEADIQANVPDVALEAAELRGVKAMLEEVENLSAVCFHMHPHEVGSSIHAAVKRAAEMRNTPS